jgi:serine/threonine protein kinase
MLEERYEIIKLLGKGRTGGVYEAEDTTLGRKVALRRFFAQAKKVDLAQYKADFENVAHSLSALQHPNLLRVYDAGVDHDGPYIISQLLTGETVHETIKNGPLPVVEAQDLAQQMLDALSTAHNEGFIHGAITPGSILMSPRARGGYLYVILDMGLSRLAPLIQGKDSILSIMADPAILAPELFGGGIADERADLYMLGHIVYMCIAGGHPFGGVDIAQAEILHKQGLPPLSNYNTEVPEDFRLWIEHLTQIDPANRPVSAVEALNSLPVLIRPGKTQAVSVNAAVPKINLGPVVQLNTTPHANPLPQSQSPLGNLTGPLTGVVPASPKTTTSRTAPHQVVVNKKNPNNTLYLIIGVVAAVLLIVVLLIGSGGDDKPTTTKSDTSSENNTSSPTRDSGLSYSERNAIKEEKIIITDFDGSKPAPVNRGWLTTNTTKQNTGLGGWVVKNGLKFALNSHENDLFDLGWKLTYIVRPSKGSHKFGMDFDKTINPGWNGDSVSLYLMFERMPDGSSRITSRDSSHQAKPDKSITVPFCGDDGWHTVVIEQQPLDEKGNYTVTIDGKPAFKDVFTRDRDFAGWKNHLFSFEGSNNESEWLIKQIKLETL